MTDVPASDEQIAELKGLAEHWPNDRPALSVAGMLSLIARVEQEKARADRLHDLAKELGDGLMSFLPAGSEYLTKVGEEYYANAMMCVPELQGVIDKAFAEGRRKGLEEAAEVADRRKHDALDYADERIRFVATRTATRIASAIRALADKEPP